MAYGASAQAWDIKRSVGEMVSLPMVVDKIYKGTILDIDANGYALQVADTDALIFAGIAAETRDNRYKVENDSTSGASSAGDKEIRSWVSGVFEFKIAAAEQNDVGKLAFVQLGSADAGQVVKESTDGTNTLVIGRIVKFVSATRVRVRIDGFAFGSGAAPNGIHS